MAKSWKVCVSVYEPDAEGANLDGYVVAYDIYEGVDAVEVFDACGEDYPQATVTLEGSCSTRESELSWLAKNDDIVVV